MFREIYKNRRVAITGHTGFKGSWISYWLKMLGAEICGFSIDVPTNPSHYRDLNIEYYYESFGDVVDFKQFLNFINSSKPEIIIHMAAQSLVRPSYDDPQLTFSTNAMGTVNVLEAARLSNSVKSVIVVTSDKCYENTESGKEFFESDRMGGHDPYSASKACAELIVNSYQKSFTDKNSLNIATVRAGNVIGGGDWSKDRLIPDIARAYKEDKVLKIRKPNAIRPWQHVLEPLSGYLLLGQHLLEGNKKMCQAWNFGPNKSDAYTVNELLQKINVYWNIDYSIDGEVVGPYEAGTLRLNCDKANKALLWQPIWPIEDALKFTANWYKNYLENQVVETEAQYSNFIQYAKKRNAIWIA